VIEGQASHMNNAADV